MILWTALFIISTLENCIWGLWYVYCSGIVMVSAVTGLRIIVNISLLNV